MDTARSPGLRLASVAPGNAERIRIRIPYGMGWRDALVANSDLVVWATHFMESHDTKARFRRVLRLVRSLSDPELDVFLGDHDY